MSLRKYARRYQFERHIFKLRYGRNPIIKTRCFDKKIAEIVSFQGNFNIIFENLGLKKQYHCVFVVK